MKSLHSILVGSMLTLVSASVLAAGSGMPGDDGKPRGGDGIPPVAAPRPAATANPGAAPAANPFGKPARGPSIDVALKAAQTIARECRQYPLGIAVVNSEAQPILTFIPDISRASHTYTAIRKAYSAVTFRAPTSQMTAKAQQDPEVAAKVRADSNLVAYSGGILLQVGEEIIGAIGVSGAEPGGHDEECALKGLAAIRDQLK
jgi:uncharacterized protein GlcG (DUF336 family)